MGFLDWLGFNNPRDAPKVPDIRNDVRDSGTLFVFGRANSGEQVDEKSAMQIATVYACVRLLAESVAQLPLHLYRVTDHDGQEKAQDHPLYKILYREPNPEMTRFSYIEAVMTHLLLWGNSYSQIIRDGKNNVLGLYPLLPENVEIDRTESGELFYIYHAYTNEVPGEKNKDVIFQRDEVLHIPGLSFNGLVGFSPIAMMKNALGTTMAVEKYGSAFFKNGAQPAGVLEHPGVLKDPQKIRDNWTRAYGGPGNAHKVAVLEEGMQYKPISLPPEDSQFLSTREFGVEEICRIFRVPPHLVQDLKRSTFNNIEHQGISFVQYTLMPWLARIEQAIVKDLLMEDEKELFFPKFNVDGLLRGDYKSRMDGYSIGISTGIISPNEARRKENMPPLPDEEGGDFHIVNGTFIKLKDVGQQYGVQDSVKSETPEEQEPQEEPPAKEEEQHENKRHTERHEERRKLRR
ncbi:MAG: phage portal protein [Clostridium sp.]|nr:phage portal protein [Clostridium sp.]